MLFLWIFGTNIENALGRVRFLVWYLRAGVAFFAHIGGFAFGILTVRIVMQQLPPSQVSHYSWR